MAPIEATAIRRQKAINQYPELFRRIIQDWSSDEPGDAAWLIYSANYLLRTGEIRWAIDPVLMNWRAKDALGVDISVLATNLDVVLLTHSHGDHFDLDLIRALKDTGITWVIPIAQQTTVFSKCGLKPERTITPIPLQPIEIPPLRITPFESLHWEQASSSWEQKPRGVPETGYLVEYKNNRWLFPGDIRNYRVEELPGFDSIDKLFAHVWLGRKCALMDEPPLLEEFCRFCKGINPRSIVLAHLDEWGRGGDDLWENRHAWLVENRFKQLLPDCQVSISHTGGKIPL